MVILVDLLTIPSSRILTTMVLKQAAPLHSILDPQSIIFYPFPALRYGRCI